MLVVEGVELLHRRDSSDALLALELEEGHLTKKLNYSLLELLVLRPAPELLRMVHGLEAERVSSHERLPVHNPLFGGSGLWSFGFKLIVYTVPLPLLLGYNQLRFLRALQLL